MELKELQDNVHEGYSCISDTCIQVRSEGFQVDGECCNECEAAFLPEDVTVDKLSEINLVRLKYGQQKVK